MESTSPVQRVKIWFFHNGADASYFDRLGDYMNDMGAGPSRDFHFLEEAGGKRWELCALIGVITRAPITLVFFHRSGKRFLSAGDQIIRLTAWAHSMAMLSSGSVEVWTGFYPV